MKRACMGMSCLVLWSGVTDLHSEQSGDFSIAVGFMLSWESGWADVKRPGGERLLGKKTWRVRNCQLKTDTNCRIQPVVMVGAKR